MWCPQEGVSFMKVLALFIHEVDSVEFYEQQEIRDYEHVKPSKGRAPSACINWTLDFQSGLIGTERLAFDLQSRRNRPERWTFDRKS